MLKNNTLTKSKHSDISNINENIDSNELDNTEPEYTGTIVRITEPNEIESQWRKLELNSTPSFFTSWSWIGPWANLVKNNTELFLFTAKAGDSLVAMCFLTISSVKRLKGLLRVKQVMINDYINHHCKMIIQYNDILNNGRHARSVWHCLYECLKSWDKNWDELAISSITEVQLGVISSACTGLVMDIDMTHREWAVKLSRELSDVATLIKQTKQKSRRQLRQSIRNFEKEIGPITVTAATTTKDALDYFEAMGKLHTKRWSEVGKLGSFANKNWVNFHKEIITNEFPNGRVVLLCIKSGTTEIGYLYGHIHNNVAYMQQTGFATMKLNILKPGYISHLYAMAYCAANGINEYNFLPDEEHSYKKFFTAPGSSIFWVNFQKKSVKQSLEKYMRNIHRFIQNYFKIYQHKHIILKR